MKKLVALILGILLLGGSMAMAEFANEDWYAEAMKASVITGNNVRLKKVIDRARSGENITIATVGGSITEGAAASTYAECWASRFAVMFGNTFGTGNNVELINSGVGGTPSPFGWMRYGKDVLERVSEKDADGLPDLVIIEYAVNDWEECTKGRAYESMVKEILSAENQPAVMLMFTVRRDGWNLQDDLQKIGDRYNLPMVSIRDGIYPHLDKDYPKSDWYSDDYHPKSVGHRMMADALMEAVKEADAAEADAADIDLTVEPVKGTDFMGLKTIYGEGETEGVTVERGSFKSIDVNSYRNTPVGWVCGKNFHHNITDGDEPLKITGVFRKCLIAWKASAESSFGTAEVLLDGVVKKTLSGGNGKWGQSEVVLVLDAKEASERTIEIRMADGNKGRKFTITAISVQ